MQRYQMHTLKETYTLTSSCVAAHAESESSQEAGGRRRDGAGEDGWADREMFF